MTPHTLRHTLASTAVAGGASPFLVGKALGHANARTTERYSHVALDPVAAIIEVASARIAEALAAGKSKANGKPGGEIVPLATVRGARF